MVEFFGINLEFGINLFIIFPISGDVLRSCQIRVICVFSPHVSLMSEKLISFIFKEFFSVRNGCLYLVNLQNNMLPLYNVRTSVFSVSVL